MRTSRQHVRDRRRPRAPAKRRSAISAIERAFARLTLTISVGAAVLFGALDPLAIRLINAQARPEREQITVASASVAASPWVLDLNGDGVADLANPTRNVVRGVDLFGSGHFGAGRDNGHRTHEGADFVAAPGSDVRAPVSGVVSKVGFAYRDDRTLQFIELTDASMDLVARVFYVDPAVEPGQTVTAGDVIGVTQSLLRRYRGITNHVHVEIVDDEGFLDPSAVLPSAEATPVLAALKTRLIAATTLKDEPRLEAGPAAGASLT